MLQALALLIINLTITIAITTDPATSSLTRWIVKLWNIAMLIAVLGYWGNLNGLESHTITDIVNAQQVGSDVKKTLADLPKIEQNKFIKQKLDEYKNKQ
ncbi:MAG: hypothetical protein QX198_06740 [Methylococcaceae bacterium]